MNTTTATPNNHGTPFKKSQLLIPLLIGLIVIVWLFLSEFDPKTFANVHFSVSSIAFLFLAIIFMFGRDFGMIWRFRLFTDKKLSWLQAFNVHILSEFTSAVTPTALGGSALVAVFMNKEGVSMGRSTAVMFAALLMDELFFVVICPIIFFLVPLNQLFNTGSTINSAISTVFWSVYGTIFLWTLVLYIGIFLRPDWIARSVKFIFRFPFLRRWHSKIAEFGDNMVQASTELKQKKLLFWVKVAVTTILTWSSRFLVVNALFLIFTPIKNPIIIFGRQVMLWIVMTVSPTPGGSGLSEYAFKAYYSDIPLGSGPILIIIVLWRLISYYLYLLLGAFVIPRWISGKFTR